MLYTIEQPRRGHGSCKQLLPSSQIRHAGPP
jgi:hypothetical protein